MTAEIAILNKLAVALAADSAVSIGRAPNIKIYNTVNKIFELSAHHPVGIMVYGRLDYMGFPWETIVKKYRADLEKKSFPTIKEYRDDFLRYLEKNIPVSNDQADENTGMIVDDFFSRSFDTIRKLVISDITSRGAFKKSKVNGIAQSQINKEIDFLKKSPFSPGFQTKALPQKYETMINEIIDDVFKQILPNETTRSKLRAYAGYIISKSELSTYRSGVVIAGFGADEWCPSLAAFELDGIVADRLKYVDRPSVDIGRFPEKEADILGFAQEDMIKSFLEGVDPTIRKYLYSLIEQGILDTSRAVLKHLLNDDSKVEEALVVMRGALNQIQETSKKNADKYILKTSTQPIRDMVRAMPKQELANLASSLIEITSLKRKVTREQETVGGEVDVALISKSEGFVWVKRKHYFPPELNSRFFKRHYSEMGSNDEK